MRLLKISLKIRLREDEKAVSHEGRVLFEESEEVEFSGYVEEHGGQFFNGYMKQSDIQDGGLLYVKGGYIGEEDIALLAVTNADSGCSLAWCVYGTSYEENKWEGFLDDTDGVPSTRFKYFFIGGDYLAYAEIKLEEIRKYAEEGENSKYYSAMRRLNQKKNRLGIAKKRGKLSFIAIWNLFDMYNYGYGPNTLIDIYPEE